MAPKGETRLPSGWKRVLFRLPIWLYRWHLGWLLGNRFLLLNHVGRKSGQPRQAVLEVVMYDGSSDTYYVASGFGPQAQWYRNLLNQPEVTIQVGCRRLRVTAEPLSAQESGAAMVDYARRNPRTARALVQFVGLEVDGREETYRRIGEEAIPFVALRSE